MSVTATGSPEGLLRNRHSPKTRTAQTTNPTVIASARCCHGFPVPLNRVPAAPANRNTTKLIPQRPVTEAIWITGRQFICVEARLPKVLCGDAIAVRYSYATQ